MTMMRDNNVDVPRAKVQANQDIVLDTPTTAWDVIEEACNAHVTGEITLTTTSPAKTKVYLTNGLVYFAERETDESLATRLVLAGALNLDQLQRGSIRLSGVEHLGRLFERDQSIDRDSVELVIELITEETLTEIAEQIVQSYRTALYRHHPSGIARWFSTQQVADEEPAAELPERVEPTGPPRVAAAAAAPTIDVVEHEAHEAVAPAVEPVVAESVSDVTAAEMRPADPIVAPVAMAVDVALPQPIQPHVAPTVDPFAAMTPLYSSNAPQQREAAPPAEIAPAAAAVPTVSEPEFTPAPSVELPRFLQTPPTAETAPAVDVASILRNLEAYGAVKPSAPAAPVVPAQPARIEPQPVAFQAVEVAPVEPVHTEQADEVPAAEPARSESGYAAPVHVEPAHVEPAHVEPGPAAPVSVEPTHVEPADVEPVHVEPVESAHAEWGHAEPTHVAPASSEWGYAGPAHVEPASAEWGHAAPTQVEAASAEPADEAPSGQPVQPAHAEWGYAAPTQADPVHVDPVHVDPAHVDTADVERADVEPAHEESLESAHTQWGDAAPVHGETVHTEGGHAAPADAEPEHVESVHADPAPLGYAGFAPAPVESSAEAVDATPDRDVVPLHDVSDGMVAADAAPVRDEPVESVPFGTASFERVTQPSTEQPPAETMSSFEPAPAERVAPLLDWLMPAPSTADASAAPSDVAGHVASSPASDIDDAPVAHDEPVGADEPVAAEAEAPFVPTLPAFTLPPVRISQQAMPLRTIPQVLTTSRPELQPEPGAPWLPRPGDAEAQRAAADAARDDAAATASDATASAASTADVSTADVSTADDAASGHVTHAATDGVTHEGAPDVGTVAGSVQPVASGDAVTATPAAATTSPATPTAPVVADSGNLDWVAELARTAQPISTSVPLTTDLSGMTPSYAMNGSAGHEPIEDVDPTPLEMPLPQVSDAPPVPSTSLGDIVSAHQEAAGSEPSPLTALAQMAPLQAVPAPTGPPSAAQPATAPPRVAPNLDSIPVPEDVAAAVRRAITAIEAATQVPSGPGAVAFGPMRVTSPGQPGAPITFDSLVTPAMMQSPPPASSNVAWPKTDEAVPHHIPEPDFWFKNPTPAPLSTERRGALRRLIDGIRRRH